jgi:hypothetical protein
MYCSMGTAGYVSVCVQLYRVGFHCRYQCIQNRIMHVITDTVLESNGCIIYM